MSIKHVLVELIQILPLTLHQPKEPAAFACWDSLNLILTESRTATIPSTPKESIISSIKSEPEMFASERKARLRYKTKQQPNLLKKEICLLCFSPYYVLEFPFTFYWKPQYNCSLIYVDTPFNDKKKISRSHVRNTRIAATVWILILIGHILISIQRPGSNLDKIQMTKMRAENK